MATQRPQKVSTLSSRKEVTLWMIQYAEANGIENIASKAVNNFRRSVFPEPLGNRKQYKANISNAQHWWVNPVEFLAPAWSNGTERSVLSTRSIPSVARSRISRKARSGRGRKRPQWKIYFHELLLDEFERLISLGIKVSFAYIHTVAMQLANSESIEVPIPGGALPITEYFVRDFCALHYIVSRCRTNNRTRSPEWRKYYDITIAIRLGLVRNKFAPDELNENTVFNFDEAHFVFDFDNGKALGFMGSKDVNYIDVSNGTEGLTVGLLARGGAHARIESFFVIFTNSRGSYPIAGVRDVVQQVSYRSGKKGWMTKKLFNVMLREPKIITKDDEGRSQTIFLDNAT